MEGVPLLHPLTAAMQALQRVLPTEKHHVTNPLMLMPPEGYRIELEEGGPVLIKDQPDIPRLPAPRQPSDNS